MVFASNISASFDSFVISYLIVISHHIDCSSLTYVGDVPASAAAAAAAANHVSPSACYCERKKSNDSGGIKFNPFYLREMKR